MNSGKTTTSGLLYSELVKIAKTKQHIFDGKKVKKDSLKFNDRNEVEDFTSILEIGNLKVGIVSAGDVAKDLKVNIQMMIDSNVDILVCCARSKNREKSAYRMILNDFSKKHEIIKEFWVEYSDDSKQKNSIKMKTIKEIINLIKG